MMILAARPGGIATKAYPDLAASSRREERGMRPNRLRRPGLGKTNALFLPFRPSTL